MAKDEIAAIVLAAGKGRRMQSDLPKVLHPIAGVPMIGYVLANIDEIAPKSITVVVGPGMESVKKEVLSRNKNIKCVVQQQRKGTGDAVKKANHLKNFNGTVLILYGDTPFITSETMQAMVNTLNSNDGLALVVLGFTPNDTAEYGRMIVDNTGKLKEIKEYRDANEEQRAIELCNAGVMAVRGNLLFKMLAKLKTKNVKGEYYLTDLVSIAGNDGYSCGVIEANENEVMGVNSRDQLAYAEDLVQEYLRHEAMSNGATMTAPHTVYLQHDTYVGKDVMIEPNVIFGPKTAIGDGVHIKSFSYIEGAVIQSGAVIGPFARIRPGSDIGEGVRVGNFVEVKNSTLGKGSKASHLSYIGDTTVGNDANIGAGTITCNYDGKNKYRTEIGASAFIGSNTSLVAPVKIGKGAVIGAGSTIVKDVKANTTVINQMPQKELDKKSRKKGK